MSANSYELKAPHLYGEGQEFESPRLHLSSLGYTPALNLILFAYSWNRRECEKRRRAPEGAQPSYSAAQE
jgi:hypothetical protein